MSNLYVVALTILILPMFFGVWFMSIEITLKAFLSLRDFIREIKNE